MKKQENNKTMNHHLVKSLLEKGLSWSEMWLEFGRNIYPYDENFKKVSEYVETHTIGISNNKSEE